MALVLAGLTFLIVALVLGVIIYFTTGATPPEKVVARRLEAIERSAKRGNISPDLNVLRDELLSDVPLLNHLLMKWKFSNRFKNYIAQSGMRIKLGRLILWSLVVATVAYLVVNFFTSIVLLSLLAAVAAAIVPMGFVAFKRNRRLKAFERTFPEAIDLLGRAVRAGHSFSTGIEMISTELPDPVAGEFRATFEEQNFGLPLRDALLNLAERIPLIDVRFFVTAILIQKETGGNLAEILDKLSHVVRERFRILGEVRIRTAQGRLTAGILMSLPPGMILLLRAVNPSYMHPLFHDPWGPIILGVAALLQVIGSIMLWKIVNIEV
jgi:tight adherence protein B